MFYTTQAYLKYKQDGIPVKSNILLFFVLCILQQFLFLAGNCSDIFLKKCK